MLFFKKEVIIRVKKNCIWKCLWEYLAQSRHLGKPTFSFLIPLLPKEWIKFHNTQAKDFRDAKISSSNGSFHTLEFNLI